jgi:hypothetical protein
VWQNDLIEQTIQVFCCKPRDHFQGEYLHTSTALSRGAPREWATSKKVLFAALESTDQARPQQNGKNPHHHQIQEHLDNDE